MAPMPHGRGRGLGKNGGYYIPKGADRYADQSEDKIVIQDDHVLYPLYQLWVMVESVLGALGFQPKYTFPDWISRMFAGDIEADAAWTYWYELQDNLHLYPNVLRNLTQQEITCANDLQAPFSGTTTWHSHFSYPECLVVNGKQLPLVRPAWQESGVIAAKPHSQGFLPSTAMVTYTKEEIKDLFWALRAMCPVDPVHPRWDHGAKTHQEPVSRRLDAYFPRFRIRDIATGPAIALAQHLFGCHSPNSPCNALSYVMTPYALASVGDDSSSARGISREAITSGERAQQVLKFDRPSFGQYMMRIATFGVKDTSARIAAQQWNLMMQSASDGNISFREIHYPRPAPQLNDAHPIIAAYTKLKNGDARYVPATLAAPAPAPARAILYHSPQYVQCDSASP